MARLSMALLFIVLLAGLAGLALHLALPRFVRNVQARRVLGQAAASGKIHLTFDDGPEPGPTEAILDALAEHGAKATFFVVGEKVARHPELFARILREGHAVGNHSQRHRHAWKSFPTQSFQDIAQGRATLAAKGVASRLWRPPYGKADLFTLLATTKRGEALVYWTRDSKDYEAGQTESELAAWMHENARPGEVVLLHDGRMTRNPGDNPTPAALKRFLATTPHKGDAFAAL